MIVIIVINFPPEWRQSPNGLIISIHLSPCIYANVRSGQPIMAFKTASNQPNHLEAGFQVHWHHRSEFDRHHAIILNNNSICNSNLLQVHLLLSSRRLFLELKIFATPNVIYVLSDGISINGSPSSCISTIGMYIFLMS